ncbi:hypothetical protein [Reichenbachiella versicolor]|uniref:hypothetical protein n=1 Tax=Reichenbachiella versicolor TaxID=1821036 RepID=UPI000D6E44F9|nr:hypothetical protein [Reichenbachiella versicolor]
MKKLVTIILFLPIGLKAQENPLSIFKPLENYIWTAEGNWGDGSQFKQVISLEFSLNDKIVKVESKGFIDTAQTQFGSRNHGVRQYDQKAKAIRFWEFDVFGNLTEGTVEKEDRDIIYKYVYGGTSVTEIWKYKSDTTYGFIVGIYEDGEWKQKFLETQFVGTEKKE